MVTVILIRHGETEWNRREIFRGRADVELNQRGREQARTLGSALEGRNLDAVYSSPLSRAVETAEAIAEHHGMAVEIEDGFIDFDYGIWQGLTHDEVRQRYPRVYRDWIERPHTVKIEGGESLRMVRRRAMRALMRIVGRHQDGTVVIVAHRVVNKVVLCAVLELASSHFWRIRQDTCALNVFEWSDGGRFLIRLLNDTCHLKHVSGERLITDF
jgi:broad specificity phosphatase PhoE